MSILVFNGAKTARFKKLVAAKSENATTTTTAALISTNIVKSNCTCIALTTFMKDSKLYSFFF